MNPRETVRVWGCFFLFVFFAFFYMVTKASSEIKEASKLHTDTRAGTCAGTHAVQKQSFLDISKKCLPFSSAVGKKGGMFVQQRNVFGIWMLN